MNRILSRRHFVEARTFTEALAVFRDSGELLRNIQSKIWENPKSGAVIAGCGGVRKIRIALPSTQKGARGGLRVLYLDLPDRERCYLLVAYSKGVKEDITKEEKAVIKALVIKLKEEKR